MITHPILSSLAMYGVKLGLDRVQRFLQFLGEPHRDYPIVHVGGTNGKGSVCAYLTRSLVEAGYRVGTTVSPHAMQLNERVQIDGRPVDDPTLIDAIEHIDRARRDWAQSQGLDAIPLTYFEFMVAVAFLVFARNQVDVAVVEVGLGGRLDATNVVHPQVTAITSVGFDHVEQLGDTLAAIAMEKAGIFKRKVPAVIGPMPNEARDVCIERARQLSAPLWKPGTELRREKRGDRWNFATPDGVLTQVKLALAGDHQAANASVALGVLHQLRRQGFLVSDDQIRVGLEQAWLPARLEEPLPGLLLDGAHNVDGTTALARFLEQRERPGTRILLWGMGTERDPVRVIAPLLPHFDEIVTTRCSHPKAYDPVELALRLQEVETLMSAGDIIDNALPEVYGEADETVVAGSLFLAGAARDLVLRGALRGITPGQGPSEEPFDEIVIDED